MSSDDTTDVPAGDDRGSEVSTTDTTEQPLQGRRDAVREKAEQVQIRQSRARLVRRTVLGAGVVAAVAVVAVVVSWAIGSAVGRPQLSPESAQDDGFVVTSIASAVSITSPDDAATPTEDSAGEATAAAATAPAPVSIHVYVDYLSSSAREWELANTSQLSAWVSEGAVTLTYHPVAMLTAKSNGTKYSLRAANAAACVATYAPDSFFQFNDDLLQRQPDIDSDGFSNDDLADIALANGSDDPKTLRTCIESEQFSAWVKDATERAVAGIDGTDGLALTGNSLVVVNGEAYVGDMSDPDEFAQFVLTSASVTESSATPTPSATGSTAP
ncbi:MAG: thioredoxin domain-containing protein [Microbacterium sp.]